MKTVIVLVAILVFSFTYVGTKMYYENKNKVAMDMCLDVMEDYSIVVKLQEIRIDQLKTQLEDCTGLQSFTKVNL